MLRTLVLLMAVSFCSHADAHETWADGKPLPTWIRQSCCGPQDVHMLDEDQVHRVAGGYRVDGYRALIPEKSALPSQDTHYWVFYNDLPNGTQSMVYCFFVPMGS